MLPKDYLSLWLTGNIYTEFSDAAGTLLLDIEKKNNGQRKLLTHSILKGKFYLN